MEQPPALEECLKLLRGERDEQRLAGLLLATKLFQGDDNASVLKVYEAVGNRFLDRLLMTGMGKGSSQAKGGEERAAYLRLSVTVLAAFCWVPEIASSEDMISKVPLVLEIISKSSSDIPIIEECLEILLLVATASQEGFTRLYESGSMKVLASNISALPDGSRSMELAMKVLQLTLIKFPSDLLINRHQSEISKLVPAIARQFALLHNALKFDALHLLATIMSSKDIEMLHGALKSVNEKDWAIYMHVGILAILQNRVASADKFRALVLVESTMSILGENWLLDCTHLPDDQNPLSVDKSLLLILECARVEVAVLLNDLAYLKYEASKNTSSTMDSIIGKQMNLVVLFSLLEQIIKLISNISGTHGGSISESTYVKVIDGLNETVGLVLDFLQDAKDHGERKGDDLLASVRIVGRYLAEAPFACKEKTEDLLEYILSIEGGDESSQFCSVRFMLPMLCQRTMEVDGCSILASFGGHKVVADYLAKAVVQSQTNLEDNGTIFLACDTIINLLLNGQKLQSQLNGSDFVDLLQSMASWAENSDDASVVMMASCIYSLVFDLTSENILLMHVGVDASLLERIAQLFVKSLNPAMQYESDDASDRSDLHQIITADILRKHHLLVKRRLKIEYILSIDGGDESSQFCSVRFMLPMLCQRTMEFDGCSILASFGGHKVVLAQWSLR